MERGLYIGAGMTVALGVTAFALMPMTGMTNTPSYIVSPFWLSLMIGVAACHLVWRAMTMATRGQENPIATLWSSIEWKQAAAVCIGSVILAANLSLFGMMKPQLGQLVDFWADPLLADIDRFFFGKDPWQLLLWFNHRGMSAIYHQGWFVWLAFVLFYLLKRPPSPEKDRLFISYIMIWCFFGPMVHLALPAAGPVFYDNLGLGDRFAALHQSRDSQFVANYLWNGYTSKVYNPAGGISAMPSVHLATMFWAIIAVRNTRWLAFAWVFTVYIFLGSIAIGWHYAVDGIAGGIGAVLCYALAGVRFDRSINLVRSTVPQLSPAAARADRASDAFAVGADLQQSAQVELR